MVRTVEPDPPEPLKRIDPRVPRAESKPEQLGHQRVAERPARHRESAPRPDAHPTGGDRVTLHAVDEDLPETDAQPSAPSPPPPPHIDVQG